MQSLFSKTEGALQELDETSYWMELLADASIVKPERVKDLLQESEELISILVAGVRTLKAQKKK